MNKPVDPEVLALAAQYRTVKLFVEFSAKLRDKRKQLPDATPCDLLGGAVKMWRKNRPVNDWFTAVLLDWPDEAKIFEDDLFFQPTRSSDNEKRSEICICFGDQVLLAQLSFDFKNSQGHLIFLNFLHSDIVENRVVKYIAELYYKYDCKELVILDNIRDISLNLSLHLSFPFVTNKLSDMGVRVSLQKN